MSTSTPVKYPLAYESSVRRTDSVPPNKLTVLFSANESTSTVFPNDSQATASDPNWKQKIALKQSASLPYRRTAVTIKNRRSSNSTSFVGPNYKAVGNFFSNQIFNVPSSWPGATDLALRDIALTRLKRKLQAHSGAMNVLVPIGELKDLRSTIRSSAELTSSLMKTLIDIKRSKGRSAFRYASKAWLTYGFGIAPMISETKKISESIVQFLERENHNAVLTGVADRDWVGGVKSTSSQAANRSFMYADTDILHNLSYEWTGGFHFPVSAANNYDAMDHFNVKVPALIPVAWELTPYSWVVDYFTNVGAFLEDVFVATPGNAVYLTCSRRYHVRAYQTTRFTKQDEPPFYTQMSSSPATSFWEYLDIERTVHASIPCAPLRFKTVDEIGKFGITKLLNLSSLLVR
jgi:hypothetical protein